MKEIIQELLQRGPENVGLDELKNIKRSFATTHHLKDLPSNIQLLKTYREMVTSKKIQKNKSIEQILRKRSIRSSSGIVAIQVLTKPYPCPGQCIFCPNDPSMPKSYIKSEPWAMRALLNQFNPTKQVRNRLTSLTLTGHETDKIEMIVLWGTRDVYPKVYKHQFIKALYDACNNFESLSIVQKSDDEDQNKFSFHLDGKEKLTIPQTIEASLKKNESAHHRIIGLTIETRPEYVTHKNCQFRRELGVTRIEMGVQSLYDEVLEANQRGHTVQQAREACHLLRQYGFKISLHVMPGLYTSTYHKDVETFQQLYTDTYFKPDEIKFYPTSVIPNTQLCKLYEAGEYIPLATSEIQKLIKETFLHIIPPYTRIKRLIRDIPENEIVAGSKITNLSQLMHTKMRKELQDGKEEKRKAFYSRLYGEYKQFRTIESFLRASSFKIQAQKEEIQTSVIGSKPDTDSFRNFVCLDTRSREIRNSSEYGVIGEAKKKTTVNLIIRKYESSVGKEYFISYEDTLGYLYGFTRLLLPQEDQALTIQGLGKETAIIRELHVYGSMETIQKWSNSSEKVQHFGLGKQLMHLAEEISKAKGYEAISVISGIGVRAYYRKLGYRKRGTYMFKKFPRKNLHHTKK